MICKKRQSHKSGDDFHTYTFDLSKLDTWKNEATCLRFDPFSKTGQSDIDYIRFVYDEKGVDFGISYICIE